MLSAKLSLINQVCTKINPEWKGILISGVYSPKDFVKMSEKDYATKETLAQMEKKAQAQNQANRTDGEAIEHSKGTVDSII